MDPSSIIIFIILILLSGFFSGTEIALMSISKPKIESFVKRKKLGAKSLKVIKKDNDRLLITLLIGNNLVNVGASALATVVSVDIAQKANLPGGWGIGIATGSVTLILLLFGEISPKSYCSKNADKISLLVAPLYVFLIKILLPITFVIELFLKLINKLFGTGPITTKITQEELEAFIDMSHEGGAVHENEHKKIKGILDLGETSAESVMTPRVQLDAVNIEMTIDQVCEYFLTHSHTRLPVFEETIDNIDYIITFKEAFKLKESGRGSKKLKDLTLDQIIKVPLNQPIDKSFELLQKSRKHLALVLDEHGGVEGIITLEDIIEEVFGDIKDETDKEDIYIKCNKDGLVSAKGDVLIQDILEELKISGVEDVGLTKEYFGENLSYIITSVLERFPEIDEVINLKGTKYIVEIKVKEVDNGKIGKLEIKKIIK